MILLVIICYEDTTKEKIHKIYRLINLAAIRCCVGIKERELTHIRTLRRDIFRQATSCSTRSVSGHSDTCAQIQDISFLYLEN